MRVYGSHLHGGPLAARAVIAAGVAYSTSRLCRFGDGTEPVPASHDAAHGALTLALALTLTPTPTLTLTLTLTLALARRGRAVDERAGAWRAP